MPTKIDEGEQTLTSLEALFQGINESLEALKSGVQVLVARMGLAEGRDAISDRADDILQATTMEVAVKNAVRYDPSKPAYSWLMGIAVLKVKEARRIQSVEYKKEGLIGDAYASDTEESARIPGLSEDEKLEKLLGENPDHSRLDETLPSGEDILVLVKEPERTLLRLAYVNEMSGKEIAQVLNTNEADAFVRLSRARKKLLLAYQKNELRGAK